MITPLTYIVFSDFDGTIASRDVGDAMFERFADMSVCSESFAAYRRGEIDARECWRRGFRSMRGIGKDEFTAFAAAQPVDPSFRSFVDFCASNAIAVNVVSDGFDAYIEPVMEREGLTALPRFMNTLEFNADGSVTPVFPYTDAECERCANCKRNHLLTRSHDNHVIVYIGDGISDRCPVRFADVVFAKDALVGYCETQNITYHRFVTFADVLTKFRTLVETTKPKKRRTAELARKEIFTME